MLVLSAFREEKNSTSSSVTARISALETKFVSGFGSLDALDNKLDGFSSRISTLETKFVSRFGSLDTFGNRLDACSSRIQSFEKTISNFDNMASAVNKLTTTVNGIDNRLDGFFSKIQSLEKAIFDNMTSDVDKLTTTVDGIAASQASLAEKISVVEDHCDVLETKLVSDFGSLNAFDNRFDVFSSRIETVEKAISNFDNMIFAVDKLITIIERIDNRLDVFFPRIQNFEKTISNFNNIASVVDKLATTDNGIATSQASLAERISVLEGRCDASEGSVIGNVSPLNILLYLVFIIIHSN